jgi:hypothetical protein
MRLQGTVRGRIADSCLEGKMNFRIATKVEGNQQNDKNDDHLAGSSKI